MMSFIAGTVVFHAFTEDAIERFRVVGGGLKQDPADIKIIRFGYVEFTSTEAAAKAISLYNMQNFEGRRISVQFSQPRHAKRGPRESPYGPLRQDRAPHPPTKTLFIGNMSFDMSDRDLNSLFREVKNVVDVRVAIDRRTGQPRGFAHADFTDIESSEQALQELRGKMVCGRALRVDFSTSTGRAALGGAAAMNKSEEGG